MGTVNRLSRAPTALRQLRSFWRGYISWRFLPERPVIPSRESTVETSNPLKVFFDSRMTGLGIWKWKHYFDIYHHQRGGVQSYGIPVRISFLALLPVCYHRRPGAGCRETLFGMATVPEMKLSTYGAASLT